ncbi:hypothetical protein TWF694_007370 [Orbilia ellipsospora]|uniref:F-box domain-containing protein n=1 Tax=Orbilia ellipsospora TaxID=2528407 RepID=A0AAV9XKY7_9PEZI
MASVSILAPFPLAANVVPLTQQKLDQPSPPITTPPLFTIPAEIHIHIGSYLSVGDQISASQTCTQWRNILLHSKYLRTSRYPSWSSKPSADLGPKIPSTHKILSVHNFETVGFQNNVEPLSGLMCLVRGKSVAGYHYLTDSENGNGQSQDGICIYDISKLSFLDEALFSPVMCAAMNSKKTKPYPYHNSIGNGNNKTGGKDPVNQYNLRLYVKNRSYMYRTNWSKKFNLDESTTVRKVIGTIVEEANDELLEWDIYGGKNVSRGNNGEDHGCWIRVFLIRNPPEREEIAVCVTRSPFYSVL